MTADDDPLVCAYVLDGNGGGRELDWAGIGAHRRDAGPLWLHLDRASPATRAWLQTTGGLEPLIVEALLAEETRPRCEAFENGLIVLLRGVNLNPGANPADMISIRVWADADRIITTRHRRLLAVQDLRDQLAAGHGPANTADVLVGLAGNLIRRMGPTIEQLEDAIDEIEDHMILGSDSALRGTLTTQRRKAIALRRYLAPQREALNRLQFIEMDWLDADDRMRLREVADRVLRYVEDLDAVKERAALLQDEMNNRLSERMNRTMYVLTVVAAIILPLGFITGLLGVNVGGIPGGESPYAFATLCILLVILVAVETWLFRKLKWL